MVRSNGAPLSLDRDIHDKPNRRIQHRLVLVFVSEKKANWGSLLSEEIMFWFYLGVPNISI